MSLRAAVVFTSVLLASGTACVLDSAAVLQGSLTAVDRNASLSTDMLAGSYAVKDGKIAHVPGLTEGKPYSGVIFYPTPQQSGENFPVLTFAHGTGVGGAFATVAEGYRTILTTVASYGFIILATESCPAVECFSAFAHDQLAMLKAAMNDPSLHPALSTADFSRTGAFGHSMGAMASISAAGGSLAKTYRPADYNLKAAVAMHPCQDAEMNSNNVEIPILYTTGSTDTICADGCAERFYSNTKSQKVLFNIKGAGHFEPSNLGDNSEKNAIALFFACWVRGEHCDQVYGSSGNAICNSVTAGHSLTECKVQGTHGPSPPTPPPAPTPDCPDVAPDDQYTCEEQQGFGKCDRDWMVRYCCKTCFNCADSCVGPTPAPPPTPSCVDVAPDDQYTCEEQQGFGKCDRDWMVGYCCKTCFNCADSCGQALNASIV